MRGFVDHSHSCPRCPACGAAHEPATLGSGARVWCDGTRADPVADAARRERAAEGERFRQALRAEHERRARERAPLEPWERESAPDTMPDAM